MGYRSVQKGDRISEYALVEKLGAGGFGEVWKAEHVQIPGKYVAIKIPTKPESMDLIHKEAVFQHQLEHPNIVRTIGLDTQHDPPYFVMEFVEGLNLRQFMQKEGILPPPYAIDIAVQVLEALAYAHARGIVHKDVKPENILVEKKRVTVARDHKAFLHYVKLTDLGLGKMPDTGVQSDMAMSEDWRTTGVRILTGTLFYSAPEQMLPNRAVDARSDIYSVGVVLYEMLTGELPLGMDLPSELNPVVTARLDSVCKRALSVDRDQRFQSARDMCNELMKAKEDLLARLVSPATPNGTSTSKVMTAHKPAAPAGGRPTRLMRVFEWTVLGFVLVLLGLSGATFLRMRAALREQAGLDGAPDPKLRLAGPVRFETTPVGATVLVDDEHTFATPCDVPLTFERHHILITREFHESRLLVLEPHTIEGRRHFKLIDEHRKQELETRDCEAGARFDRLEMQHQTGRLVIETPNLQHVLVKLDGDPVSHTPYSDDVLAGRHTVELSREGYETLTFEVTVRGGATVKRPFALIPIGTAPPSGTKHVVKIKTAPEGATVYIEGARQPLLTPCDIELTAGVHRMRLELSYHEPWEERVTVNAATPMIELALARISGLVEFDSDPRGAEVLIDRQSLGRTPLRQFWPGGLHTAEFRLDGHYTKSIPFTVNDRTQQVTLMASLQRVPPGSLTVTCEVPGAEILIRHRDGKIAKRGSFENHKLEPGPYIVRVLGLERPVEIEPGLERKLSFTAKDVGMAYVPAGSFEYGSRDNRPGDILAKTLELPAFYIDITEVTNDQYREFHEHLKRAGDQAHARCDPSEGRNKDHTPHSWTRPDMKEYLGGRQPVVGVDYFDACAYAGWAGKRLPTEEEWEKAARGADGRRFPWGNEWNEQDVRCNWFDFRGELDGYGEVTAPVGSFEAGRSPYGVHDMAGNVWEWTSSYRDHPRTSNRIVRGASFLERSHTVWSRDFHPPTQNQKATVGFRCVVDAK